MPLLTERLNQYAQGYKHFAPPEQRTNTTVNDFSQSGLKANMLAKEATNGSNGNWRELLHDIPIGLKDLIHNGAKPRWWRDVLNTKPAEAIS